MSVGLTTFRLDCRIPGRYSLEETAHDTQNTGDGAVRLAGGRLCWRSYYGWLRFRRPSRTRPRRAFGLRDTRVHPTVLMPLTALRYLLAKLPALPTSHSGPHSSFTSPIRTFTGFAMTCMTVVCHVVSTCFGGPYSTATATQECSPSNG